MKKSLFFLLSLLLTVAGYQAQEVAPAEAAPAAPEFEQSAYAGDWTVSVGVGMRNFHHPKFHGASIPGFQGYVLDEATGEYLEPTNENLLRAWESRYPGLNNAQKRLTFADFDGASANGAGSYGIADQTAPAVGFSTGLWSKDALDLALVANFQYYTMDSASSGLASGAASKAYDKWIQRVVGAITPMPGNFTEEATGKGGAFLGSSYTKFAMDLYVIDLGLSLGYNLNNGVRAYVAAGPSLSIADMESHGVSATVSGDTQLLSSGRANETEFNWGVYASAGANYWFNESIGLAAEVRYDKGIGDVGTKYVSQSLDTFGGQLKLQYRF